MVAAVTALDAAWQRYKAEDTASSCAVWRGATSYLADVEDAYREGWAAALTVPAGRAHHITTGPDWEGGTQVCHAACSCLWDTTAPDGGALAVVILAHLHGHDDAMCPDGCGCRLGTDDADARECGCGGLCSGDDDSRASCSCGWRASATDGGWLSTETVAHLLTHAPGGENDR